MHRKTFQFAWGISLLVIVSLSCNLISGVEERAGGVRETFQSVATDVQTGRDVIATGRAITTQILGNEAIQTAQAIATREGPSLLATVQTFATEEGPSLLATAMTVATEEGPALQDTLQAYATQQGPGLVETAQAVATQLAASGQAPEDIPLVAGERLDFFASDQIVSYSTSLDFQTVLNFYEQEMPVYGWFKINDSSVASESSALLNYEKQDSTASLAIVANPVNNQTSVVINVQNR